jgi:Lectin C-type domain
MRARAVAPAILSLALLSLVRCITPDEADYVGGSSSSSNDAASDDGNSSADSLESLDGSSDVDAGACVAAHQRFNTATGHCYEFTTANVDWGAAEAKCVSSGGHLVAINDPAELAFIVQFVKDELAGIDAATFSTFWTGLNDLDSSTGPLTYQWSDGQPLTFENWLTGFPTGKGCVVQYTTGKASAGWQDYQCIVDTSYLCER